MGSGVIYRIRHIAQMRRAVCQRQLSFLLLTVCRHSHGKMSLDTCIHNHNQIMKLAYCSFNFLLNFVL